MWPDVLSESAAQRVHGSIWKITLQAKTSAKFCSRLVSFLSPFSATADPALAHTDGPLIDRAQVCGKCPHEKNSRDFYPPSCLYPRVYRASRRCSNPPRRLWLTRLRDFYPPSCLYPRVRMASRRCFNPAAQTLVVWPGWRELDIHRLNVEAGAAKASGYRVASAGAKGPSCWLGFAGQRAWACKTGLQRQTGLWPWAPQVGWA